MTTSERTWWRLAWLCLAVAVPLRLAFFAGFGLGDDPNESIALMNFAHTLRLDPTNFMTYRVVNMLVRGFAYHLSPGSELAFILPILAFALGTHAVTMGLAGDILGGRGAFLTSLLFLVTPYETLASTANVPDYFHAFFGAAAGWAVYRGVARARVLPMLVGALMVVLAFLSRLFAILLLPTFAVATLVTLRRWREWLVFWVALVVLLGGVCLWDRSLSGNPFNWILNSSGGMGGHDVTNILGYVLMVYPRYLFGHDDNGHWMFGLTGWCAALGALVALGRTLRGRASAAETVVLIGFFVLGGLFEFLPHKPSLTAYWSHPRIFRYVAQIAPVVYLCAAYLLDRLWTVPRRLPVHLGPVLCLVVVGFGIWQTPRVAEPLVDADRDARWLVDYLHAHEGSKPVPVWTDFWRVGFILARYERFDAAWHPRGVLPDSKDEKVRFLREAPPGTLVVTGGATLPWYSGIDLIVSLSRLDFQVPENWALVAQRDAPVRPWRAEPIRIWSVGPVSTDGATPRPPA